MVELLEIFGSDRMVVNVARVSYGKEAENYTDLQNESLIKYLIKHGHTSPFRHPKLQFRISCPIYVERQLFKHQVGIDVNSISGRYVDFSDTYTYISEWRKQSTSSKQGSSGPLSEDDQIFCSGIEKSVIETAKKAYKELIKIGVSKEQARTVLPLSLNTTFIMTTSLQAFLNMCDLRLKPDAQQETREVVAEMLELVRALPRNPFEKTLKYWSNDKY